MKSLTGDSIKRLLKTETLGKIIYVFEEVGSTNEIALELGRNGSPEGTMVIANSQTKGKGRLQRSWISPGESNLYMSVIFRPRIAAKEASIFTLVCSIAVAEAIILEGPANTLIKWPNDVLINEKKVSGILTETELKEDRVDFVVVGIGVNLNMTREMMKQQMREVAEIATSLREATGREIERAQFIANLTYKLEIWYQKFLREGKSTIIKEWMERWGAINRRVRVRFDEMTIEGVASGIDENGYLILQREDGTTEKIVSGEVILL
jgi:BirA family biotin operon repressor/biotin-[acetyl-CoA-carboxylase] ligase